MNPSLLVCFERKRTNTPTTHTASQTNRERERERDERLGRKASSKHRKRSATPASTRPRHGALQRHDVHAFEHLAEDAIRAVSPAFSFEPLSFVFVVLLLILK